MNRPELVKAVAAHVGVEPDVVDTVLRGAVEVIEAVVAGGERVTISRFARFDSTDRAARVIRNPATGEPLEIKASKKPKITPLKGFKEAVMTPSEAPKLAEGVWPPPAPEPVPKWPEVREQAARNPNDTAEAAGAPS